MKPLPEQRRGETLDDFTRRLEGERYRHVGECNVCNYDQDHCNACDADGTFTPDQHACNCHLGGGYGYRLRELLRDSREKLDARDKATPTASELLRQAAHAAKIERARLVVGEINKLINAASTELGTAIGMDIVVNFTAGMILDCKMDEEQFFGAVRAAMVEFQSAEN